MSSLRPSSQRTFTPHLTRGAIVAASVLVAPIVAVVAALMFDTRSRGPAPTPAATGSVATPPVDATVALGTGSAVTVPSSFLSVSTEYWTIPVWARQMGLLRRVLAMLSPDGPIRLRIGGDSADRALWAPTKELPEWVFELTPSWLRQTSQIVSQTRSPTRCSSQCSGSTGPGSSPAIAVSAIAGVNLASQRGKSRDARPHARQTQAHAAGAVGPTDRAGPSIAPQA